MRALSNDFWQAEFQVEEQAVTLYLQAWSDRF